MTRHGRDMIAVLLFIALALLILTIAARADELSTGSDYKDCLYNLLRADENSQDWDTTKVYRCVSMGITFVEGVSKANVVHDTLTFNTDFSTAADTGFFYALSTNAGSGGVLNVFYVDQNINDLISLSKRQLEDFGQDIASHSTDQSKRTYMWTEVHDSLLVYPLPDVSYVMHVISYKVSDWVVYNTATTGLPLFYRLLALEMAYGYAMLMTGTAEGFQKYSQVRRSVLEAIYSVPPEPQVEVQSLGMEQTP